MEVTVLARDYSRAVLPFPDALLRLSRLRALSLQIPCSVSSDLISSSRKLDNALDNIIDDQAGSCLMPRLSHPSIAHCPCRCLLGHGCAQKITK